MNAALPVGPRGCWFPGGLALGFAALGVAVAACQSWLQFQPPNTVSCVGGQPGLIERLVEWLGQQAPPLFLARGFCDEAGLVILCLSLANWALVAFAACLAVDAWVLVREHRTDQPLGVDPTVVSPGAI